MTTPIPIAMAQQALGGGLGIPLALAAVGVVVLVLASLSVSVATLQEALEHPRAIALAGPVGDGLRDLHLPGVDVFGDRAGDVGHEGLEIQVRIEQIPDDGRRPAVRRHGAGRRPRGLAPTRGARREMREHGPHLLWTHVVAPERLGGDELVKRAVQLADVAELERRELLEDAALKAHAALVAARPEDRDARLVVRGADVHDQPAREARDESFVDIGNLDGRPVARHDDLASRPLQCVEQPQQLTLRLAAARQKLHVVEQQHVDAAVALLEHCHGVRQRRERIDDPRRLPVGDHRAEYRGVAFRRFREGHRLKLQSFAGEIDDRDVVRVPRRQVGQVLPERTGDLGEGNGGMLIFVDGRERYEYVAWADVEQVDFERISVRVYERAEPQGTTTYQ